MPRDVIKAVSGYSRIFKGFAFWFFPDFHLYIYVHTQLIVCFINVSRLLLLLHVSGTQVTNN